MEKLNWLIHLQHIRGEIGVCKSLINSEITRSQGKNEYVFFKQVKTLSMFSFQIIFLEIERKLNYRFGFGSLLYHRIKVIQKSFHY